MEDKLVFTIFKPDAADTRRGVIRVSSEALVILEELHRKTGLPIKTLASKMIEYASKHVEVDFVS